MIQLCSFLLLALIPARGAAVDESWLSVFTQSEDRLVVVSSGGPISTIQAAIDQAVQNKRDGLSTRILVRRGVYREALRLQHIPGDAFIILEGEPGTIVSGSDIWDSWVLEEPGLYSHSWPYNWGPWDRPDGWPEIIGEQIRRQELVFVNGERMRQVLAREDLVPGTIYVDETGDTILLMTNSPLGSSTVEVGVRETILFVQAVNNFLVRNIRFQHAASAWLQAAVHMGNSSGHAIFDVSVGQNGGTGLFLPSLVGALMQGGDITQNGLSGGQIYRTINVILRNVHVAENNWRGEEANYHRWFLGGIKSVLNHGLLIEDSLFEGNRTRGYWCDYDCVDIEIRRSTFRNNLISGIFLEHSPGPVRVERSNLSGNSMSGLSLSNVGTIDINQVTFADNPIAPIEFWGPGNEVENWETGEQVALPRCVSLTIRQSVFADNGPWIDPQKHCQNFITEPATAPPSRPVLLDVR